MRNLDEEFDKLKTDEERKEFLMDIIDNEEVGTPEMKTFLGKHTDLLLEARNGNKTNFLNFTEEEYTKSNIMISKFMGWKIDNSFPDKDRIYRSPGGAIELDTTFKFHKDWNLLMDVVEKIEDSGYRLIESALDTYSVCDDSMKKKIYAGVEDYLKSNTNLWFNYKKELI